MEPFSGGPNLERHFHKVVIAWIVMVMVRGQMKWKFDVHDGLSIVDESLIL